MISIKETTDLKNELISKAQEKHKKAKSFKQFRKDARQKPLKKGEVRKLVNGKWVSNVKEEVEHIEEMASASNLKFGMPQGSPGGTIKKPTVVMPDGTSLPGLGGGGGGTNAITAKAMTKSLGTRTKDISNLIKRPFRTKADRVAANTTTRFASEAKIAASPNPGPAPVKPGDVPVAPSSPWLPGKSPAKLAKKLREAKSAAWQRKEGKNKKGGLNEKGRKSYERENPGSDLKAPQPGGGPRKRSFCARMGGVKGPMKKPDGSPTRKALALRKWKC